MLRLTAAFATMSSQEDLFCNDDPGGGTTGAVADPVVEERDSNADEATGSGDNGGHEVGDGDNGGHVVGNNGGHEMVDDDVALVDDDVVAAAEVGKPKRDRKRVFSYAEALDAKRVAKGNAAEACRQMIAILKQTTTDVDNVDLFVVCLLRSLANCC